jgi:molybdate transport system permease protein
VVEAVLMLPLVLPPTVVGYLLLLTMGSNGWPGSVIYRWFHYTVLWRFEGAVIASAIVGFPLLYLPAKAGFQGVDRDLLDVARVFGAGRLQRFWHVSLPLARRSIMSGLILAFARALGEFGATVMVIGMDPETPTLPIRIYNSYYDRNYGAGVPALVAMVAISLGLIAAYNWTIGKRKE